jgi:hypothetical protein
MSRVSRYPEEGDQDSKNNGQQLVRAWFRRANMTEPIGARVSKRRTKVAHAGNRHQLMVGFALGYGVREWASRQDRLQQRRRRPF